MSYLKIVAARALAISSLFILAVSAHPQESYTITDLGTLGGSYTSARAINNSGQITGTSTLAGDTIYHAFLYTNGQMLDIDTLDTNSSSGLGINTAGQVTGAAEIGASQTAFVFANGAMTNIGGLGGSYEAGAAMNDGGLVAGTGDPSCNCTFHAFLFSNGTISDLGTLWPGNSYAESAATAINASGQVTGWSQVLDATTHYALTHAFLYSNGIMSDIGTLGGYYSSGEAINASGQVTGFSSLTGNLASHAFLFSNGTMKDLGSLGSQYSAGYAINTAGQITGYSYTASGVQHAMLYTPGTSALTDLNTLLPSGSGWTLTLGTGINDKGQITGNGVVNGENHAFLLTPVSPMKQLTAALTNLIDSSRLNAQQKTILITYLSLLPQAFKSLTPTQKAIYIQITNAFIANVSKLQSTGKISASLATQLTAVSQDIMNVLKS